MLNTGWAGLAGAALAAMALVACGEADDGVSTEGSGGASSRVATSQEAACTPAAECVEGQGACDGDTRVTCSQGKLVKQVCSDEECKAQGRGPLLGCLLDDNDQPTCQCGCKLEVDDTCVDQKLLSFCTEAGTSYRVECTEEICQEAGYKGLASGPACAVGSSGAYCNCETVCTPGLKCSESGGKAIITQCDGKTETKITCDEVCGESGEVASPTCSGVNEQGTKVCFCGVSKCSSEGAQQCVGQSKLRFCENGVWVESPCSDKVCKDAGFSGWSGQCGEGSSGKDVCLCNN